MICSLIKWDTNDKISVDFGPKASLIAPPPSRPISIKRKEKG